ncbi:MAG TPA: ABC transporter permease [Longimicrobiaceae bacterium]|nr:ABC transporter permease [Longimicrobiaceae bacterium]
MRSREALRMAFEAIRAHKLRGFFTVLGTVVGVMFLIAVITLIEGMNRYVEKEFKGAIFGVNTVTLRRMPSMDMDAGSAQYREWSRRRRITFEDTDWLDARLETPGTVALAATNTGKVRGPRGREADNVWVTGASASYFQVREMEMESGRPFSSQEDRLGIPVVVIGKDVAEALFEGRDPLGQVVYVRGFPYRVIGVLEKQGSLFGMSMDNQAIAPIRSDLEGFVTNNRRGTVDEMTFKVPHERYIPTAKAELEALMRVRHGLRPEQPNDFELETADESLGFWARIRTILLLALPALVGISLVVGAIVIMNIMLVSVSERTREIGIRKSLGARRGDILLQFLFESSALSGVGALLGIGLGVALAWVVQAATPLPASVAPWSVALAVGLGVGVGVAAGVYPAYRASRLDPIVALRAE